MKFNNLIILLAAFIVIISCSKRKTVTVTKMGELENLIRDGDLSTRAKLKDLENQSDIYGLGYVTGLNGFITILDSRPYVSYIDSGEIKMDSTFNAEATLLLYSKVTIWKEFPIPKLVTTWKQLEGFISNKAERYDVSTTKVFPFLLKGTAAELSWQVLSWNPNLKMITYRRILQEGSSGKLLNEPIQAIGFYSKEADKILAHQEASIHVHFLNHDHSLAGRIEDIQLDGRMTLYVPVDSE